MITYATTGAAGFPKETLDLLADGKVLHLDDFTPGGGARPEALD